MKKLFYLLALLGIFAVGCEELASGLSNGGDQTENPDNGNDEGDVVDFDINVDDNIIVSFEGGEVEVTITTSLEYSVNVAEEAEEWLSVTKASAEGVDTLTLTVAVNEAEQERSAEVTLSVDTANYSCSFTITQLGWGDDIWNELGEGIFYEDFISWVYGGIAGNVASVAIEESITRPGYYRMVDPFCEENIPIFIGGMPSDITCAEVGYVEIDARNPEAVFIPFQPVGITIDGLGEIWIGYVSEEYGEMVDGNISFPVNALGLFVAGIPSEGYYANTSGMFQIVLPGAPNNAKLRLRSPSLSIENVTDTSFTVTWKAIENADYYVVGSNVAEETIVYNTFYTVDVYSKGGYTVNVHAVSDNPRYLDSSTISIVQFYDLITPEECDWAEAKIIVDPEDGVSIFCKGTGIVDCTMVLFSYDGNNAVDYSASELFLWGDNYWFDLAEVNAGGQAVKVGTEVDSGYQAYLFMMHEGGDTVFFKLLYNPANS
ncbi:MAG: BACON domain-containing protein [Alistipes sp.]|nr:BACON domain-containing protein [Alistipes sp.]